MIERRSGREYMDAPDLTGADLEQCLLDIARVNRFCGGLKTTLDAFDILVPKDATELRVLDLGTGGGDVPEAMLRWGKRRGVAVEVVAVDFNPVIVEWAQTRRVHLPEIDWRCEDAFALSYGDGDFDIVHAALFLHHFADGALGELLKKMYALCRLGVVVNDLHRHRLAYVGAHLAGLLLAGSAMFRHDGPLSVLRGFVPHELEALAQRHAVPLLVERHWAFRLMGVARK